MNNPPCLIFRKRDCSYSAWNEDGRLIGYCCSFSPLDRKVRDLGYEPVALNSRIAATIIDKVQNKNPSSSL